MTSESLLRAIGGFVCAAVATLASIATSSAAVTTHDEAFWRALKAQDFRPAPEQPVLPLALEAATNLLAATNPELRDGIGYEALATWIYTERRLDQGDLDRLRAVLVANASRGLGAGDSNDLFLRSFSTLVLSVVAAADLQKPFLDQTRFDELVDLGIALLTNERDLRGYVPGKGWGHSTAHCADLLKFLSRNSRLTGAQQAQIVAAIATRLQTAGQVFVWGEDERLAATLAAIARRPDLNPAPFAAWFKHLSEEHAAVWKGTFDPLRYRSVRAQLNTLSHLSADLESDTTSDALQTVRIELHQLRRKTQ